MYTVLLYTVPPWHRSKPGNLRLFARCKQFWASDGVSEFICVIDKDEKEAVEAEESCGFTFNDVEKISTYALFYSVALPRCTVHSTP